MINKFKVLNEHLDAIGYPIGSQKPKSIYSEGTIELIDTGLKGKYKEWKKFLPTILLSRVEYDFGVIGETICFDGKSVWVRDNNGKVSNGTTQELLKEFKLRNLTERFEFINPDSKYFSVRMKESGNNYLLTFINSINETKMEYYINKATFLLDKKIEYRKGNTSITTFGKYKTTGGVKLPYEITNETPELERIEKIKIQKYNFTNLQRSVFSTPKKDIRDFKFLKNNRAENIPFFFSGGHIYIDVKIKGKKGRFVVDSGAGKSVIDSEFIKELGIRKQGVMRAQGISGNADISFAHIKEMNFDSIKITGQTLVTADLRSLFRRATGTEIDGLLGFDFLSRFITKIDFAGRMISCYDPAKFKYRGKGKKVKVELDDNIFCVPVIIEGKYSGNASIDTGAKGISIFHHFVKQHKLENRKGLIAISGGLGAIHYSKTARFGKIEIGGFKIDNPLINFPINEVRGAFSDRSKIGNLGTNLFRHFIVYLDYKNNQIILERGKDFNKKFPENRSGVQFEYGKNRIAMVRFISPDSPAERSGLKVKDIVISFDSTPITKFQNLIEVGEFIATLMGKEVEIKIKRKNKNLDLKMDLR